MANFLDENTLRYLWQKIVGLFAKKKDIPTKTSQLQNDSGFITTGDIPEGAAASTTVPKMDGVASVGTELAFARGDHVHPHDTTKADAATVTELEGRIDTVENDIDEFSTAIENKADKSMTLAGYGITDAYTKSEVDAKVSSVYHPAGSIAYASLPEPSVSNVGNVYSVTDSFTTDDRFIEGEGKQYPAGTNVAVIAQDSTYKYDVLAGFVDLSNYWSKTELTAMNNGDIDDIVAES